MEVVIRDDPDTAPGGIRSDRGAPRASVGKVGSDGSPRGLHAVGFAGHPSPAGIRAYAEVGVSEVMWVFRDPFDLETIERLGEVRAALGSIGPGGG